MPDYTRALHRATRGCGYDPTNWTGNAGIGWWLEMFRTMRRLLVDDGATPGDLDVFRDAVLAAINAAPDRELSGNDREALRTVLLNALDGMPRTYETALAPKVDFLQRVNFPAQEGGA